MKVPGLLGPSDPPPFVRMNPDGASPVVIVCDHGGQAIPSALGDLGLSAEARARHIFYDIGARGISEHLSDWLDAPAVIASFSRLVIDLNRPTDDFTSIREISDGVVVEGNRNLDEAAREARRQELFWTYHGAVAEAIAQRHEAGHLPAILSVHSCTDEMRGIKRPWHIGVLSNRDRRMAEALIDALRKQEPELNIGDNKPYSGMDPYGYTIETHAIPQGLPNVLLEVRQDLIGTPEGILRFSKIIHDALKVVLADASLFTRFGGT